MIERLKALQADKRQFANNSELSSRLKTDYDFRKEVEVLYKHFLNKTVQGCNSCYADAYVELIHLNIEKMKEKEECLFTLRAGALLRDKGGNSKYLCSNANITDELALYHLKTNPKCVELFDALPKGYQKLVEEFKIPEKEQEVLDNQIELIEKQLQEAQNKVAELEGKLTKSEATVKEKETKATELESQNKQLATQVAELEGKLKAKQSK